MNEQLLLSGYNVAILSDAEYVLGFKGLSDKRMLLMKCGKTYVKQASSKQSITKKDPSWLQYPINLWSCQVSGCIETFSERSQESVQGFRRRTSEYP